MIKNILLLLLLTFTLVGCTIEKRHHQKGLHVQWKHKTQANQVALDKDPSEIILTEKVDINKNIVISEPLNNNNSGELSITSHNVISNTNISNFTQQNEEKPVKITKRKTYSTDRHINASEVANIKHDFAGDGLLLLTSIFMALGTLLSFRTSRKRLNNISKWAAKNNKKSQLIIGGIQFPLSLMAVYGGFNLSKMGIEISDTTSYIMAGLLALSFASVPFIKRKNELVLEKKLNRRRLGFLGIILSGTMLFTFAGNKIASDSQAPFHESLEQFDQGIYNSVPDASDDSINKNKVRKYVNAGLVIIGVLLFAILIALFCAAVCGAFFSFAYVSAGIGYAALGIGLIGIAILAILGMRELVRSKFFRDPYLTE